MKAQVLTGINQMELTDWPKPQIQKDTDVLLKVKVVGVCGSDVHYYETGRIGSQVVQYPYLVGHECSAVVEEVGSAVTRCKPGDEVAVDPASWCDQCDQCKMGRENTCRNLKFLGTPGQGDGCLCEFIVMPQKSCFPSGGKLTLEQAALCEPFTIGVYTVKQSGVSAGSKVAVLGSGPIGLSCLAAAKAWNVGPVYMTDILDDRVRVAGDAGAAWAGNPHKQDIITAIRGKEPLGVDAAYECAGQQETIDQAIEILRPGGTLMLVGIPREERVSFLIDKVRRKEITIINVRRQNVCTELAMDLVAEGKAEIDFMVTHRYSFNQAKEAFDLVSGYRDGVVKAMIHFDES